MSRSLAHNVRSLVQVCVANLLFVAFRDVDEWPLLFLKVCLSSSSQLPLGSYD